MVSELSFTGNPQNALFIVGSKIPFRLTTDVIYLSTNERTVDVVTSIPRLKSGKEGAIGSLILCTIAVNHARRIN